MNISLSKRWVYYVVKTYLGFSLWIFFFFLLLWIIKVYIVWMKGKKVTIKILQIESFAGTLWDGLFCKVFAKCSLTLDSSASSMCFSHALFARTFLANLLRASRKITVIFILCLILHRLNSKLNTIKSHKIQGN